MKHLKHKLKKGLVFFLSLAMIAGLAPAMSGGAHVVKAATGVAPSVSAYATKEQMMDGTFAPNSTSGEAANYGKIVFGKKSDGKTQEWYILGKDEGVSGDNTILFAASPIATNQLFENDASDNKAFQSRFGVYESNPLEVHPNHYGASDLRVVLQGMAKNTSYFTTAEQGLMNDTTVTTEDTNDTNDTNDSSVTYTTTDKLYALQGNFYDDKKLWAGTSDSTVLAKSSYWSSGDAFWLRSPDDNFFYYALIADPSYYNCATCCYVNAPRAVQPASNLNLSSVLFASSAKAASSDTVSGTLTDGTAMTLRLNGTGKDIGTVTYNTTGDIKVAKGSTSQTVALVVQGNDGTNDWYYSKQITGTETVNVSAIETETNTPTSIDLSTCKIWLEITDTDGLIYAVNADKEIEPINTTYVTKEQLMSSFKPYSDGTAVNIGKLVFGKNSSGDAQKWYILGKDSGVSGDNTIIFAASPIAKNQVFENDYSNNKAFQSSFGVYASNPSEVYPNHYGASELRVALQNMATDTSYFTSAEQGLMNDTTVTTKDTNKSVTYTTTDKLYALAADDHGFSYNTIKAGSGDSTVLAMSSYWSSGAWFWLRTPNDSSCALLATTGGHVDYIRVFFDSAVQPASNLNLSSVLFASAATAASSDTVSGTLTDGTAMTLRLNGTGKNIGTVTYNTTTGDIKVAKGSTSQTVALVVQGNDGTNDWYYSKQIAGPETVNASDIKSALSLISGIDLSACKIWLEITDSTEKLTYAVNATETVDSDISSVAITDIDTPTANTTLDTSAACATTGVSSTTPSVTWTPGASTAGYNTSYTASVTLTADATHVFADTVAATVNGNTATSVTKNSNGTLTVTYKFDATAKDKLTSITAPDPKTVNNGTTYEAMGLPATVAIVTEGNTVTSAAVTWDTTTPESGSYDPNKLEVQRITLNGTVTCPDTIDANGVSLTTTITITISAAGIVGTPTATPAPGIYDQNQSVTLTSSTDGATIYYTTDGSVPAFTSGGPSGTTQEYREAITVTGTEGQPAVTTIKAIAVKSGMQNSGVAEFTYTIELPLADITSVAITDIGAPTVNTALDTEAACATPGVSSTTPSVTWTPGASTAGYNTSYTASVTLTADATHVFADTAAATVNGNTATSVTKNSNGTLTVTYKFDATAKDKLTSITAPQRMIVANGTAYAEMNLPATVAIVTEGNTVTSASVTWDTTTPASGSYDQSVLTEQSVTLKGTVTCPDTIDANGVSPTTTIDITISAAGIVGAPTATPAAGTYAENQLVTLTSSTDGATIYYTTDGSEPALAGGVPSGTTVEYTTPIAVTGTEGQSVVTTIKAIAVKSGMQNSAVMSFTYTINLPLSKHTITATAGTNGSISPSGAVEVTEGESKTFTITANEGYEIDTLKVDNADVEKTTSYTFTNVTGDHTIAVTFSQKATPVEAPSITSQPQNASVKVGETATFTVTATGTSPSYQWQIDRNDGNGWVNISGANAASYTTSSVDESCNGFRYKCVISNSAGTVESSTVTLTVQDADSSDNTYQIIEGANSSWTHDSDGNIAIRGNGDFSKFVGVKVDGALIDRNNYTATEGSTIITLKDSYLNTLSVGTHTFEIFWTDGSAGTTFTLSANTNDNDSSETDNDNGGSASDDSNDGTSDSQAAADSSAAATSVPAYVTHIVQKGDTLGAIARKYGCTVAEIKMENNNLIKNINLIYPGWLLKIPQNNGNAVSGGSQQVSVSPNAGKTRIHVVKRGENLWAISRKYGCTGAEIIALNSRLKANPNLLYAGWELVIPER